MDTQPKKILMSSAVVEVTKLAHGELNLVLEHNLGWEGSCWIYELEEPQALPPFTRETKADHEEEFIEVLTKNLEWGGDSGKPWGDPNWMVNQQSADKKPTYNDEERDEIAEYIKANVRDPGELEGEDGMPPYLLGWDVLGRSVQFFFPIEIRPFDEGRAEKSGNAIDQLNNPVLVKYENLREWRAHKRARG